MRVIGWADQVMQALKGPKMDDNDWFSEDAATFGDRLAGARDAAGLSQAGLAQKLGVSTKILQAWEDDAKEPRANRLQMLSGMLNVSLSWLLSGRGEGPSAPEEDVALSSDINDMLIEMRGLRGEVARSGDRLAQLEKRLRKALQDG